MVLEYFVGYKYIVLLRSQDLVSIGGCFRRSVGEAPAACYSVRHCVETVLHCITECK